MSLPQPFDGDAERRLWQAALHTASGMGTERRCQLWQCVHAHLGQQRGAHGPRHSGSFCLEGLRVRIVVVRLRGCCMRLLLCCHLQPPRQAWAGCA